MQTETIRFGNQNFTLFPGGELFWNDRQTVIVSDLHLEKSSYFAKKDQLLPPYDSFETLSRLKKFIETKNVENINFLGDLVHDKLAIKRMPSEIKELLLRILKSVKPVLTLGNHDNKEIFVNLNVDICSHIVIDGICFSHMPIKNSKYQIFGHYHPKIRMKIKDLGIWKNCFLLDSKSLLMPAYGSYTGGLSIDDPEIKNNFEKNSIAYPFTKTSIFRIKI